MIRARSLVLTLAAAAACSSSPSATPDAPGPVIDAPSTGPDAATTCARTAAAADRVRHVVVSHPYDADGNASGQYEVLDLSASGVLTRAQHTFAMGPASFGSIAFTQDGQVGVLGDDNGALGVFVLADDGTATVTANAMQLPYYAARVVMDPSGANVWVIDDDTGSNGGGIYRVDLACDGTPTDRGLVAAGSTPGALAFTGGHAVIAAGAMLDSPGSDSVHLLDWTTTPPTRIASADAFGDQMDIIGGAALSDDGTTFLIGDNSGFADVPNRVAVVTVSATGVTPLNVVTPVDDPEGIVISPFGSVAIVTDAFGNAIHILDNAGSGGAWRVRGDVAYASGTGPPQLPGDVTSIHVGMLRGHAFVSEVAGIRQLAFDGSGGSGGSGAVTDLGSLDFGSDLQDSIGAIGVTP